MLWLRLPLHGRQIDAFLRQLVQRRHLAKARDHVRQLVCHVIHFFVSGPAAQAEANRRVREIVARAERLQDV